MAVRIRLARRGRKELALYDVVVADARAPRDGRFIEKIGTYNPNTDPATVLIDTEKAFEWVMKGAQPTDTVRAMLSYRGVMLRKHLQIGVIKGALSQEEADQRFENWLKDKETKIQGKIEKLQKDKADRDKARLEAEIKVNEARAALLKQREEEANAANAPAEAPEEVAESPSEEAPEPAAEVAAEEKVEAVAEKVEEKEPAEGKVENAEEQAPAKDASEEKPVEAKEESAVEEKKEEKASAVEAEEKVEDTPEAEANLKAEEKVEAPKAETKEEPTAEAEEGEKK
jgi:small subunit ribosomal protein S16